MSEFTKRMKALSPEKCRLLEAHLKKKSFELAPFIAREVLRTPIHREAEQGIVKGEFGLLPIPTQFFTRYFPDKHHWNIFNLIYTPENIDETALTKAISKVVEHHDGLRIVFLFGGDSIRQYNRGLDEGELFSLKVVDLRNEKNDTERIIQEVKEMNTSMELMRGSLLKFGLFKTKRGVHLLMAVYHLVADGVSTRIIMDDLISCYYQALNGRDSNPRPQSTSTAVDLDRSRPRLQPKGNPG